MKKSHIATCLFTVLMLSTVLPLCSCEQQETPLSDGENVLTINATLDGELDVNTRSYSGDVSIVDKGFTIAGYLLKGQYALETMTIAPNVFDKSKGYQAISKLSATNAKFKIPLPLIGLGTEDEPTYLSVQAWTQGDTDTGYGITGQTGNSSVGMPYLNINLQSPEGKQGDIVAAQKIDHLNDYVITAIDLDFKHILSKMSFVVKNSTGTGISVKDVKLAVAGDALYSKAKYTFNGSDSIGIYSDYSTYYPKKEYTPSGWATTPTLTDAGTATLGELLLIPQKALAGFITVKVTYTVNGDAMNTPITRTLPLKANDLRAGKNYIYTLDVNANAISVVNVTVGGWKEAPTNALPMVPGECKPDVLLLLDGYDEPYQHTDGKWYWLDRSGYNRHVTLGNGYVSYDEIKHGYVFTKSGGAGGVIPNLGSAVSALTVDIVAECTGSHNDQRPFILGGSSFQAPFTNARVDWNYPGNYVAWNIASSTIVKQSFWSLIWSTTKATIYHNAVLQADQTFSSSSRNLASGNTLAIYDGRISYLKVTGTIRPVKEIVDDYKDCQQRFGIVEPASPYMPPVTDGLIFCFDGRSGTETINGVKYWRDQVGKNDARLFGNVTYSDKGFKVSPNNFMSMVYNVAMSNDYTIEIVLKPDGLSTGHPIFWGTSINEGSSGRIISLHFPYPDSGVVYIDAPGGADRYYGAWPSGVGGWTDLRQIAIRRQYSAKKSEFFMYNRVVLQNDVSSKPVSVDISTKVCSIMDFGGHNWNGKIYAVRFYNRPLTNDEMKKNYQYDKTTFNF